jgi:hypothetical protein
MRQAAVFFEAALGCLDIVLSWGCLDMVLFLLCGLLVWRGALGGIGCVGQWAHRSTRGTELLCCSI